MRAAFNIELKAKKVTNLPTVTHKDVLDTRMEQIVRDIPSGKRHLRSGIQETIDAFLRPDGTISGEQMQSNWFPAVDVDVFISHSHDDLELARNLKDWLKTKLGLLSFIDSDVWGHADTLLSTIDRRYCLNDDGKTF
ncbi:MAG: hypothetical protein Q8M65_02650, partial [Rhodoglobus sp.]|nr:hypothetical protein [Rhodoglobus sp.]